MSLTETAVDSGIFQGTFTFTNAGNSSGTTLRVSNNDELTVTYQEPMGGRIMATFDGVTESGLVDMSDFAIIPDSTPFNPVGYAVNLKLVDTQLDPVQGTVTVTLSYANADLAGSDEHYLRLFQGEDFGDGTANWNANPISATDENGFTVGLNSNAKTITATTTATQGVFILGYDIGSPGGAGGGLGRPGAGLVVDFVASIASSSSGGGGGGGGGSISTPGSQTNNNQNAGSSTSASMSSGQSVSSRVDIESSEQDVGLLFDNVVTGGTVSVLARDPSDLANLFDSVQTEGSLSSSPSQGLLVIYGTNSTTIGDVYDISTSAGFLFDGDVFITVPYDESLVIQSGASESDVRLLHYNGNQWEDRTVSVDEINNTVTGQLSSLSPVVVAVIEDGTFDLLYLQVHPLDGVSVNDASFLTSQTGGAAIGQAIDVGATLKNLYRTDQAYSFVVQIEDETGQAVYVDWQAWSLLRGEIQRVVSNWTPNYDGNYSATILILDKDPDSPDLANPIAQRVSVTTLHVASLNDS